jgi:transcriptional regulator with XRE-family HTH domain
LPDHTSPSARGRRLAAELRRLRERTGMTGDEVAQELGWSGSKISRIELQRTGVKQADLQKLLDLYQVGEAHRAELLTLAREATQKGRLERVTAGFPSGYTEYLRAEADARSLWNWEPQVVPGLLQTPDYARAIMQGWQSIFALPPGEIDRRIQTRLVRRQRLRGDHPLEMSAVVDESVLHRRFGSPAVMREQLGQLVADSRLPNVELRILPLDSDHSMATGAFAYLRFARVHEVPMPDFVSVEQLDISQHPDEEELTNWYRLTFEYLRKQALDPDRSRSLIAETAQRLWSRPGQPGRRH